ncbi:MAG: ArsR family transcriptional regulator [Rhodospirillales bacterium]|nr:ArsR family transcriptional regulator [Rhodospirillales bacterium]
MTKSFAASVREDVRLAILQILARDLGQSCNHVIMRDAIEAAMAHSLTEDEIREHFAWLENQGLIRTEAIGRYVVATLHRKGRLVVQGRERVEGVRLPDVDERADYL